MDATRVREAFDTLFKQAKKRNFTQSVEFLVTLRDLDLKKPDQQVDFYHELPHVPGEPKRIVALVDVDLADQARKLADFVILKDEFPKYKENPKLAKKLAEDYDYFIAQATLMKDVAAVFGRILGPRGKMPSPKGGMIVPPKANLEPVIQRLRKTVPVRVKTRPLYQVKIGREDQDREELVENLLSVYRALVTHLPQEERNVKAAYVKLTMSPAIRII